MDSVVGMQSHAGLTGPDELALPHFEKCGTARCGFSASVFFQALHPRNCWVRLDFFGSGLNILHRQPVHSIAFHKNRLWKSNFETVFAVGP